MTATARDRRDRLRAMLADLKMPGALEAVDGVLAKVDRGAVTAGEAIEQVLGAQIALRNNRRLQAALRSSRLPAVKTLAQFDFTFQPSLKREQIESLHELGFLDRRENVNPCSARLGWARGARRILGSAGPPDRGRQRPQRPLWTHSHRLRPVRRARRLRGVVPLGASHLRRLVHEYVEHYHRERNHQGCEN